MDKFVDQNTNLSWLKYDDHNARQFTQQNEILSSWSTAPNIRRYITGGEPLAELLLKYLGQHNNLFYCYQDEDLVGATVIVQPIWGNQESSIEFLIVNPKFQHLGIGTRIVKSIINNPQFFVGEKYQDLYSTVVDEENIPSQKVFLKNNFKPFKKPNIYYYSGFIKYYCSPRNLQQDFNITTNNQDIQEI